jgi:indolepyruvate ferredoxin oxidoreductase beta subunit
MRQDIVIAGVGGQGTILASRLIAQAAIASGFSVRTAETIGMAQRGGSVLGYIRLSDAAAQQAPLSPVIGPGKADLLIAFEPAEAARNLHLLKAGGYLISAIRPIKPVQSQLSKDASQNYDLDKILAWLKDCSAGLVDNQPSFHLELIDAACICDELGSIKVLNVVLLGATLATGVLAVDAADLKTAICELVPARLLSLNEQAYQAGQAAVSLT